MDVDRTWGSTLVKNHDENKTYILVKLSESFSHAIQEYSAPTIKFHGPRGAIKFPNGKSYDFSLEQSDNSVECIRQTKNRWESVGKIARCLHVKGKDDVYQRTRTKMEAAEQEKRKYCAKLLDSPEHNNTTTTNSGSNHHNNHSHYQNNNLHHHNSTSNSMNTLNNSSATINQNNANSVNYSSMRAAKLLEATGKASKSKTKSTTNNTTSSSSANITTAVVNAPAIADIKSTLSSSSSSSSASTTSSSYSSAAPATSTNNNNNCVNLSKYPDITDVKQLKRYKAEFDKDFREYQNLHGYLHRIEERFKKLRESLKQSVEGSPEWESAKEEIFNEYERVKGDSNFHRARSKYKQLYNKLAHIKEKIFQFKQDHRDKFNNRKKRKR